LYDEWAEYHRRNPRFYEWFCAKAQEAIDKGYKEYSVALIVEEIRRDHPTIGVKNGHRAYYARLWLREHPEHPKFFKVNHVAED
jgi:hypothetical protein